jgi:hypothetical protein
MIVVGIAAIVAGCAIMLSRSSLVEFTRASSARGFGPTPSRRYGAFVVWLVGGACVAIGVVAIVEALA